MSGVAGTVDSLRANRDEVLRLAAEQGITAVKVTPTGRLLVSAGPEVTYLGLARFLVALERELGVATDDAVFDSVLAADDHDPDFDRAVGL
jgi:hypothetical protein